MNLECFTNKNLRDATTDLFTQLGISLVTRVEGALNTKDTLGNKYKNCSPFTNIRKLYLSGVIENASFVAGEMDNKRNEAVTTILDKKVYNSLIIFALELDKSPTRSEIADLTRAFNQLSKARPVCLVIKYKKDKTNLISIALSERFKYPQDWREGEKIGKVIILRDINIEETHAGHLRILENLAKHNAENFNMLHTAWLKVLNIKTLNDEFYEKLVAKVDKKGNIVEKGWYFKCLDDLKINLTKAAKILKSDSVEKTKNEILKKHPQKDVHIALTEAIENIVDNELRPQATIRIIIRMMFIWFMKEKHLIKPDFFTIDFAEKFLKSENTYYNAIIQNLFFAVLNAKISERRFRDKNDKKYNADGNEYGIYQLFRYEKLFKSGKSSDFLTLTDTIPFVNGGLFTCHDRKFKRDQQNNYVIDGFSDNPTDMAIIHDSVIFELIALFEDFVFTIEESTPLEQDIALDPELLGMVFEKLMSFYNYNTETKEDARKSTGSFYTPREIVDYMCMESLKESLKSKLPDLHMHINDLIDNNADNNLSPSQKKRISSAITKLKILDPACGSGAFPVGMFNLMLRIVEKLDRCKTTHKHKLEIIENCIYGVDIENIAVEITKLRFFISLLVDYERPLNPEDFEVLPNLETKFMVADTLIGFDLHGLGDLFTNSILLPKCKALTQAFLPFTTAKTPTDKAIIKDNFEAQKQELVSNIEEIMKGNKTADDDAEKIRAWDPFNVCRCAPFFDSAIMFGQPEGFDLIIGNPPYVESRSSKVSDEKKDAYQNQVRLDHGEMAKYITRGVDLLIYFYPRMHTLLSDHGVGCLIVENAWLNTDYGFKASRFILNKFERIDIVDSQFRHFDPESANINTIISLLQKNNHDKKVTFSLMTQKNNHSAVEVIKEYKCEDKLLGQMKWGFIMYSHPTILEIFTKIFKVGHSIDQSFYNVGQGVNDKENVYIAKELEKNLLNKNNIINAVFKEYKYLYSDYDYFLYHQFEEHNGDSKLLQSINKIEFLKGKEIKKPFPTIIMPRGIGQKHFAGLIEHCAFSNSFVDVYVNTDDNEKKLNIWLFCNSSIFFLYREISGRKNLGGGLLKSEAIDIKLIPLYFPITSERVIKELIKKMGTPVDLIERLKMDIQKEIDSYVFRYFSIADHRDLIISELKRLVQLRYNKAKT